MRLLLAALLTGTTLSLPALAKERVFFVAPADNAVVQSPFKVTFGVEGMKIGALGDLKPGFGHHHLIVNGPAIAKGVVIPADDKHLHFGGGQSETELKLAPGQYTLTLQFGDGAHRSYGETMSSTIKVTVATPPPPSKGS